jgi:ribosomal protection tetracycline resistance protein
MQQYLNLGILAHVDAGKTTLTERLLHTVGVIDRIGSVDDGTTQTDSLSLERQRGITIKSAVVSFVVNDVTINLIDTPGHPDFIAEVERVLNVLDGAILVISAVEGVQPQTRILMRALKRLGIPTLIFVNKIDRAGARPEEVFAEIAKILTSAVVAMGEVGDPGTKSATVSLFTANNDESTSRLAESLAEQNARLMAAYVDDSTPPLTRLHEELARQTAQALIHPVFYGTAMHGTGVDVLIDAVTALLPTADGESTIDETTSGVVFKIERGSNGEKIAYVRMFSGTIQVRERIAVQGGLEQVITAIQVFESGSTVQRRSVAGGFIAKVWGLGDIQIGDFLGTPKPGMQTHQLARPTLETAIVPRSAGEKGLLHTALVQLAEQDPLINLRQDDVRQELYLSLNGEVQKEVIQQTLDNDFNIEVEFNETTTICIERPTGVGTALETIGKSPNPFLATVGLRIEPAPVGSGIEFRLDVDPRTVPQKVFKSVDEFESAMDNYVRNSLKQGLNGWEVTDCVVTMTHSGYSPPASRSSDFRYLTPPVVIRALKMANTAVCEPVHAFYLEGPSSMLSAALGTLARLETTPRTTSTTESTFVLEGDILASRMHQLQQQMMAITRGEGVLEFTFDHYQPVKGTPPNRPRTDHNPLDFKEYLRHVVRRM